MGQVRHSLRSLVTNLNNNQPLVLLTGDLNEDNIINAADYSIAKASYGSMVGSPNWNDNVDFNKDGIINSLDLVILMKNFGRSGNSGTWYSPTPPFGSASAISQGGSPRFAVEAGYQPATASSGGYWLWVPVTH